MHTYTIMHNTSFVPTIACIDAELCKLPIYGSHDDVHRQSRTITDYDPGLSNASLTVISYVINKLWYVYDFFGPLY